MGAVRRGIINMPNQPIDWEQAAINAVRDRYINGRICVEELESCVEKILTDLDRAVVEYLIPKGLPAPQPAPTDADQARPR